jgi:hypothetical protein
MRFAIWPAVTSAASQMPTTGKRGGPGGVEPGVVETGDDRRIGIRRIHQRLDQAGHGERLVIIALDRDRPHRRRDGGYFSAGRSDGARGGADRFGHRGGRVRIDDQDFCHGGIV